MEDAEQKKVVLERLINCLDESKLDSMIDIMDSLSEINKKAPEG